MGERGAYESVEDVARTSYGRLVALLSSRTRDIAGAEDALADAFVAALRTWPTRGVPDFPDRWMLTAARRNLIGTARRRDVAHRALPTLAMLDAERTETDASGPVGDERLRLLFVCAHPAIDRAMHAPLMLQTVLGLDAVRIAGAFVVAPATLGQRLVRAKRKIRDAGIAFAVPSAEQLPERLGAVLDAVYAAYGTGWDDPLGADDKRLGLTAEAIRLARLLCTLAPERGETHGLLALMLHSHARVAARRDGTGGFVPLGLQDISRWSSALVDEADARLHLGFTTGEVGPYLVQAAIQSVHNRRVRGDEVDWSWIVALYDGLVRLQPTIGSWVARAAAVLEAEGPVAARRDLDGIDGALVAEYQPYWAVRAEVLLRGGAAAPEVWAAAQQAIARSPDASVRRYLADRFGATGPGADPPATGACAGQEG